jgi:hypothetical protein
MKPGKVISLGLIVFLSVVILGTVPCIAKSRLNTFWVSGVIVQPEIKTSEIHNPPPYIYRMSDGTMIIWDGIKNLNVPFTTPGVIENTAPKVVKVYVLFKTERTAILKKVELFNGHFPVASYEPNLSGDYTTIKPENTFLVKNQNFGLGVNVRLVVDFGGEYQNPTYRDTQGLFFLHAVGIDFKRYW